MSENLLVSTEWLNDHLTDPALRIVDIRGHILPASQPPPHYFNHREDYLQSHIPGAVFVDWVHEITDPADPRHARVAPPDRFAAAMQRAGIGSEAFVVAYDDSKSMFAARLWWMLNYYGHAQVAVLDGGWLKWVRETRPVNAEVPTVQQTAFHAVPNPAWIRFGEQVHQLLGTSAQLLDARTVEEFAGKSARASRKGHIPGALNIPRTDLVAADETMLSPDQLREKFSSVGINEDAPEVITYCNSGVSSSFELLALKVAGFQNGVLYDGSWKDWGNDPAKPIE